MNEDCCKKLTEIAADMAHYLELSKCTDSSPETMKGTDYVLDEYYNLLSDYDNS